MITIRGGYALRDDGTIDADKNQNTDMTYYAIAIGFCMGDILFVASNELHGWTNVGDEPATYFLIQWNT